MCLALFCAEISAMNVEDITEEWLISQGAETRYTDHIAHFKRLFSQVHVKTFLEFGLGFSTKYFIDNSEKVISVEFVTPGIGPGWLQYCMDLYHGCPTWTPIAYFSGKGIDTNWTPHKYMGVESVHHAATYQPVHYKSYASIDSSFLDDLECFVQQFDAVDVAFVDAGVCLRGDLVQVLFDKAPIIVAHDVDPKEMRHINDVYGYGRIVVPANYVEIYIPFGMGTAFWIKQEDPYLEIIKDLQDYAGDKKVTGY